MKIAALKCSGGLNQGNDFINFGGQSVLEKIYSKNDIEYFEFFDSCLPQWKTKEILTPSTTEYIQNNFDIIFIFSGSAGSPTLYNSLFRSVDKLDIPFVALGIGCGGQYDNSEKNAINDIYNLKNCKAVITRDSKTFEFLDNNEKALSGIDLAFFAPETIKPRKENSKFKYAVVNYEPNGIPTDVDAAYDLKKQLEGVYEKVYIVENTTTPSSHSIDNFVQIGYADELWNFYANSSYVVSTRVHTCICCVSSGVTFTYLGSDSGGKRGRNCLFNEIGLTLKSEEEYDGKDYLDKIANAKSNYITKLEKFLNEE